MIFISMVNYHFTPEEVAQLPSSNEETEKKIALAPPEARAELLRFESNFFICFLCFPHPTLSLGMSICKTITGAAVSKPYAALIDQFTSVSPVKPKLVGILATNSAPSRAYASWTEKACEAVGIEYELRIVNCEGETAGQGDVEEAILAANVDEGVHGIMVYVSRVLLPRAWGRRDS